MTALRDRIVHGSQPLKENRAAQMNPEKSIIDRKALNVTRKVTRRKLNENSVEENRKRKRKTPDMRARKRPSALDLKNSTVRRAIIQWYCGTFPKLPQEIAQKTQNNC